MSGSTFFLDDLFNDTEQKDVVIYASGVELYFVLRVDSGLSYVYSLDGDVISLVQWRFVSNRLHVERASGTYVISLIRYDDNGVMVASVAWVLGKKVLSQTTSFLNVMDDLDSKGVVKYISKQGYKINLLDGSLMGQIIGRVKQYKKYIAPISLSLLMFFFFFYF